MDKAKVQDMRVQITKALADIADGTGMTLRLGNINFTDSGFRGTIHCEEIGANGLPERYKADWDEAVSLNLVKKEWFGVETMSRDSNYKVVGYDFKKRKSNIMLQRQDNGKIYCTTQIHFYKPEFKRDKDKIKPLRIVG
jgi:hypothetical protein